MFLTYSQTLNGCEALGFLDEPGEEWGKPLVGQTW